MIVIFHRRPGTQSEKRMNAAVEMEGFIRPSRNAANLPDAYDDIPRDPERCWKYQRSGRKAWCR